MKLPIPIDDLAVRVNLLTGRRSYDDIRLAIIKDLFGVKNIEDATMLKLNLQRHPGLELKKSKLIRLARKFFLFPHDI